MKSTLIRITLILFLFVLFISNYTFAETRTFVKEYTYQASEDDSRNSCRVVALREVKRLLLEELGIYLQSITEVQDFKLTKDQIVTLSAGIVRTEIINEKWDGRIYWFSAKIAADLGEVIKALDNLRQDRAKTKELEEVRLQSEELLRENERLRKELATSKGEKHEQNKVDYDKTVNCLKAVEWFERGIAYGSSGNYGDAVSAFSNAIEFNPANAKAHGNRGLVYGKLGNYREAIRDCDNAIKLDPSLAGAYACRGFTYGVVGNSRQAIDDLKIAAGLGDKDAQNFLRSQGVGW